MTGTKILWWTSLVPLFPVVIFYKYQHHQHSTVTSTMRHHHQSFTYHGRYPGWWWTSLVPPFPVVIFYRYQHHQIHIIKTLQPPAPWDIIIKDLHTMAGTLIDGWGWWYRYSCGTRDQRCLDLCLPHHPSHKLHLGFLLLVFLFLLLYLLSLCFGCIRYKSRTGGVHKDLKSNLTLSWT